MFSQETKSTQENHTTKNIINKGKTGNWKDKLNVEMIEKLKTWEDKWLKSDSDLKFVYEL